MENRSASVSFLLLRGLAGLIVLLGFSTSVFATVTLFTVNFQTVSNSSGTLVRGTVQCDAGHQTFVSGSVIQLVVNRLAQTLFSAPVNCDGSVQEWSAVLVGNFRCSAPTGTCGRQRIWGRLY
jgi:hypothetical protein